MSDVLLDAKWILCPARRCYPVRARRRDRGRHEVVALLCGNSTSVTRRNFELILPAQRNQGVQQACADEARLASRRTPPRRCSHTEHRGWAAASWMVWVAPALSARRNWTQSLCTVGFPAGAAGWVRDHGTGNGQRQYVTGETEVGTGWLLPLDHLHFGWLLRDNRPLVR